MLSEVQQRSTVQNGANFVLRIISVKVWGLGFLAREPTSN